MLITSGHLYILYVKNHPFYNKRDESIEIISFGATRNPQKYIAVYNAYSMKPRFPKYILVPYDTLIICSDKTEIHSDPPPPPTHTHTQYQVVSA